MKILASIRCGAVAALPVLFCWILSTPALADIFPLELLDQQAAITNAAGAVPVAISGDYLVAGPPHSPATMFHLEDGQWQELGSWTWPAAAYGQSLVALDGNTVLVGMPSAAGSGRAYAFTLSSQPGLNAWNIMDRTNGTGVYYRYQHPLTLAQRQLANTNGWTLTVRCRMVDDFYFSSNEPSCFVDYAVNPTNRFLIWFSLDANLNLVAQLNGLQTFVLTTNGDGWAAYHTHQIVFNPTNDTADYYFDGVKMNATPWSPTSVTPLNGVRFGDGSSVGEGSMDWNLVKLTTQGTNVLALYDAGTASNPATELDPTNQGWNLVADNHPGSGSTNGPVSPDFETVWPLQAVVVSKGASEAQFGYGFGSSIAISSNTVVVGAPYQNNYRGSAYVFVRNGSNWVQQAELSPNPPAAYRDWFGYRVALNANTAMVSDADNEDAGSNAAVYVFVRTGTNWTQQWRFTNSPQVELNEFGSEFGNTVAVDGDHAAVSDFINNNNAGVVYVFGRTNGVWSQQDTLLPKNALNYGDFGQALALKGNIIVASGSYYTNSYIFVLGRSGWVQATNFAYPDKSAKVGFVAADGTKVVVSEGVGTGVIHIYSPDYSNPTAVADYVSKLLYYPNAEGSLLYDPNQAAFRYKTLLYAQGTNGVLPQFNNIADLYGPAEQARADFAESEVAKGLAWHPDDPTLGNLLLDIYYDRTEAEVIFADNLLAQGEAAHFPTAISGLPIPASGFMIDNEIPLYEQALATNRYALENYFSLFTNNLGVAGSPPLGYQIFTNLVPTRGLMPATYLDTNGVAQSVTSNNVALFSGYKDLTLLFNQLQNYGETANTLGKLLLARQGPGDNMEASNVVGSGQQLLFLNGEMLKRMFATLPSTNDPSGLAQSIEGWSDSLSALTTLEQNLVGGANLLGFAPDFMLFVYTLPGGATYHSSYDALHDYLASNAQSPLLLAETKLAAAEASYATYRENQAQLADQMTGLDQTYESRLRDIVGAYPGDPTYGDNPTNNPGSLLDQQYEIIEQARLKILQNQTDLSNLVQRVQIELDRASAVSNVLINYGSQEASIDEKIGQIQADQAAANAAANGVNTLFQAPKAIGAAAVGIVGFVNGLNAGVQYQAEKEKGQLEAEKEQNAAIEQAQITGVDSAAEVKTMMLNMNTLVIESQEAALQLQQALDQMAGLYREKQQLEQKIAQENASLASRYYADPSYRLLAQSDMVAADMAFNDAQKWLFFTERGLAYKWNTPFDHLYDGITWTENTLFKLRNADELQEYFNAMNDWDALADASDAATQTNIDYFSVRDDFFGYPLTNNLGQTLTYPDPITGQLVGGLQAFRDRLRQLQVTASTANGPYSYIDLHFSTVRQIPGKAFFEGPIFSTDGTVLRYGLALDKIQGITINLPGTVGGTYVQGQLVYGGTSFIRNLAVGTYNPAQPDMLANEMTAYSTRHWYYSLAEDTWTSEEAQSTSANLELTTQAGVEPPGGQITTFNERSVAASDWELQIPTYELGAQVLNLDQLNDIEIWFKHSATDRY